MYDNIACLEGESGFSLIIKLVSKENSSLLKIDITIISDWYNASALLKVNTTKLQEFITELASEKSSVSFYDNTGSFELIVNSDGLGHFNISGNLSKSINDDNNLRYDFETDNYYLRIFLTQMNSLFNN